MRHDGLSEQERERYERQLVLPEVGRLGQERLGAARVATVGVGGLGGTCALYLAAAGVGNLVLVDFDQVELGNLQRQVLFTPKQVGENKASAAAERLREFNPLANVEALSERVDSDNAACVLAGADVVIDATDNFPSRYAINRACVSLRQPLVHASAYRFEGQVMTIVPGSGPCYACLFPVEPPPEEVPACRIGGILGPATGVLGCIQAAEAMKLILGKGECLVGRMLAVDLLTAHVRLLKVERLRDCPVCGRMSAEKGNPSA